MRNAECEIKEDFRTAKIHRHFEFRTSNFELIIIYNKDKISK